MLNKVCVKCNLRKAITNFEKESSTVCVRCKPPRKRKTKKED